MRDAGAQKALIDSGELSRNAEWIYSFDPVVSTRSHLAPSSTFHPAFGSAHHPVEFIRKPAGDKGSPTSTVSRPRRLRISRSSGSMAVSELPIYGPPYHRPTTCVVGVRLGSRSRTNAHPVISA